MKLIHRVVCGMVAMIIALSLSASTANAATILLEGDLFYTTFGGPGGGTPQVFKIHFVYDNTPQIVYSLNTLLITLAGADGIIFNPNTNNLLIGEQSQNLVAQITPGGALVPPSPVAAGGAGDPQAYNLVATPDKTSLLALPNFAGSTGGTDINVLPLTPALAAGTTHAVTGDDTSLTGIAFFNGTAYYVAGPDFSSTGFLGTIDLGTFKTTRLTAITNGTQGSLPAHAISADKNGLIISGLNEIWQLTVSGTTATVVSKVTTPAADGPPTGPFAQWDQTSVDGNGHLFAANNNGNLLFIDYSGSGLIGSPVFSDERFLVSHLDDIANGGGAPPSQGTGCPATQGFWHKANHWPTVPGSVDGVTLALTPKITLTIGAGPGSETYSQAQILELLPSGSLHTGGVENDLSQFIAASLNLIAGAQHTAGIDSIISTIATDLTTTPPTNLFSIAGQVNIPPQAAIDLAAFGGALDAYNSATGLMCTEGAGLSVGGN